MEMPVTKLKDWAEERGIELAGTEEICRETIDQLMEEYGDNPEELQNSFDDMIVEGERIAYQIFREHQQEYAEKVFQEFMDYLIENGEINGIEDTGEVMGERFELFKDFFMSLSQSRRSRAGTTFEYLHNFLFKELGYPFEEQPDIDGKPDFVMPSADYYRENALNSIVFTAKRTLRERWRQIVTEGARGIGFYLATIDRDLSDNAINEMKEHRIFVVIPEEIRIEEYEDYSNVISFSQFFDEHLEPKMNIWEREGIADI